MIFKHKLLFKPLNVFSDGSLILNIHSQKLLLFSKDFKIFQKNLKKNSVVNLNKIDNIKNYRKKLFK